MLCAPILTKINARIHWDERQIDKVEQTPYSCSLCWGTGQNASGINRYCSIYVLLFYSWVVQLPDNMNVLQCWLFSRKTSERTPRSILIWDAVKEDTYSLHFVVEIQNHSWLYARVIPGIHSSVTSLHMTERWWHLFQVFFLIKKSFENCRNIEAIWNYKNKLLIFLVIFLVRCGKLRKFKYLSEFSRW